MLKNKKRIISICICIAVFIVAVIVFTLIKNHYSASSVYFRAEEKTYNSVLNKSNNNFDDLLDINSLSEEIPYNITGSFNTIGKVQTLLPEDADSTSKSLVDLFLKNKKIEYDIREDTKNRKGILSADVADQKGEMLMQVLLSKSGTKTTLNIPTFFKETLTYNVAKDRKFNSNKKLKIIDKEFSFTFDDILTIMSLYNYSEGNGKNTQLKMTNQISEKLESVLFNNYMELAKVSTMSSLEDSTFKDTGVTGKQITVHFEKENLKAFTSNVFSELVADTEFVDTSYSLLIDFLASEVQKPNLSKNLDFKKEYIDFLKAAADYDFFNDVTMNIWVDKDEYIFGRSIDFNMSKEFENASFNVSSFSYTDSGLEDIQYSIVIPNIVTLDFVYRNTLSGTTEASNPDTLKITIDGLGINMSLDADITSIHENSSINKNIDFTYTFKSMEGKTKIPGNINYSRIDDISSNVSNHTLIASITPENSEDPIGFSATMNYLFNVSFELPEYVTKNEFNLNKAKNTDIVQKMENINQGFQTLIYNYIVDGYTTEQ